MMKIQGDKYLKQALSLFADALVYTGHLTDMQRGVNKEEEMNGIMERVFWKLAYMLPKRVVYFAAIRLIAYASGGRYGDTVVPELGAMDAVGRWSKDHFGWT